MGVYNRGTPIGRILTYMAKLKKPSPAQIRAARERAGLTQTEAGQVVHANLRSWQKWEGGERGMHVGFWELFLIKTGGKP